MTTNSTKIARRLGFIALLGALVCGGVGCQSGGGGAILRHAAQIGPGGAARLRFLPPAAGEVLLHNRGPGTVDLRVVYESSAEPMTVTLDERGSHNSKATDFAEIHMRSTAVGDAAPEPVVVEYAIRLESLGETIVRLEYPDP